jgi:c-di-GMP-binding flagellar brake protein YcgR
MLIAPGTKVRVEVYLADPPVVFNTLIRGCDLKTIEVAAPTVNGKKIGVPPETRVVLIETSDSGLLYLDTTVEQVKTSPSVQWVLRSPGFEGIRKIQRRREERFAVDLHIKWHMKDESAYEPTSLHLININSYGALVSVDRDLAVGDDLIVDLTSLVHVSGQMTDRRVTTRGRVVRKIGEVGTVYGITFETLERLERVHLLEAIRRLKSRVV